MKKILPILVISAMLLVSVPAVLADPPVEPFSEADYPGVSDHITTMATVAGSGGDPGDPGGNSPPIVKVKWEYDMDIGCHDADASICGTLTHTTESPLSFHSSIS